MKWNLLALFLVGIKLNFCQEINFSAEKNGIKIIGYKPTTPFLDAKLSLKNPPIKTDTGKYVFQFETQNFELGAQTQPLSALTCANSAKGQHIHFILDNAPYQAHYDKNISATLKEGHHVLLAFISRSFHESIKHKDAYILTEFNVGKEGLNNFNIKKPHLFFSRPKGEYVNEKETNRILLDFYLVNCQLAKNGFKVRATINGTSFILTSWQPYFLENLPLGENKIKLELLDKKGNLVNSPFNPTERVIKLLKEPLNSN